MMPPYKNLSIKVSPHARENKLEWVGMNTYIAKVTVAPEDGKANEAIIKLLSKTLHMAKSRFTIIRGATDRHKVIGILPE
jgi:uncharacterized protein YggU (UPF0235/DUF167 family)